MSTSILLFEPKFEIETKRIEKPKRTKKWRNAKNRNPSLDARCNNGFSFYSSAPNRKLYPTHVRDSGWTEKREDRRPFVRCLQLVVKPTSSIINQITFRYETPAVYRPKRAEFSPLSLSSTLLFNRRQTFTVKAIVSRSYVACSTTKKHSALEFDTNFDVVHVKRFP